MKTLIWIKSGVAALGLALASAAISASPALPMSPVRASAAEARPALWQISDSDTTVYLFGTIHVLPGGVGWRTPAFDQVMAQSEGLVLETVIEDTPTTLAYNFNRLGLREGLPPFLQRFDLKNRPAIAAAIDKSGVPGSRYDQMETWAAILTLVGRQAGSSGFKGADGVETILKKNFLRAGKPVGQLETNIDQLNLYDGLSENAQRAMLVGMIGEPGARAKSVRGQLDAMLGTWVSGDVDGIARSFNAELAQQPELRAALLTRRNARWASWIDQRMDRPGSVMVAVGAGHLAGKGSVLQALEGHGYTVSRIQ